MVLIKDFTILNFDSVDNGRVQSSNSGSKLDAIVDAIAGVKNGIPSKLSGSGADSTLSAAISAIGAAKESCKNLSELYDQIIELYKNIDYETASDIMAAFNQSLLLYELGFLSLEDLQNLYEKNLYTYDEDGNLVEINHEILEGIRDDMLLYAEPLGANLSGGLCIVLDPTTGASTKVDEAFGVRLQAVVNIFSELGIHVPLGCGYNPNSENSFSKHRRGLAMDWDTGHAININYNNGDDIVLIRQKGKETTESAYNVFYNTPECSIEEFLTCPNGKSIPYEKGLYAKIPEEIDIPEKYQKYVVNGLSNVIQSTDVTDGTPSAKNLSFVSIDGKFLDVNKIYADAGIQAGVPGDTWPGGWTNYESHHVELITDDYTKRQGIYNSDGIKLTDSEVNQYHEIAQILDSMN